MNWSEDTLLGRIEAGDVVDVKKDIESVIAKKIDTKIQEKIKAVKDSFNGIETKED